MNINTTSIENISKEIHLTEEQQIAIDKILEWFVNPKAIIEFKLGGYAGTGKTTLIKYLLAPDITEITEPIRAVVCAFTGKACYVLQKKGIHSAQTIHSLIYDCEVLKDGSVQYFLRTTLEERPNLIIVDEASMISDELYRDLLTFNIKLLFIGDPGQLEPVGSNPNLMKNPDYVLTKIHRQAEKSPIITLATHVRNGGTIRSLPSTLDTQIQGKYIDDVLLRSVNQVICAKNATRNLLNRRIRGSDKLPGISIGDKLICLRNNRRFGVFNGLICIVQYISFEHADYYLCGVRDEVGKEYNSIKIWKKPFFSEIQKTDIIPKELLYFDYGYAITCHKSQGSEWDSVLVYDEVMYMTDMKRWRYTAITRAAKKLIYCI